MVHRKIQVVITAEVDAYSEDEVTDEEARRFVLQTVRNNPAVHNTTVTIL